MTNASRGSAGAQGLWRKVFVDVWNEPWFTSLSATGQRLYFLATAGPQTNRCGMFFFSLAEAAERLDVDPIELRAQFEQVCSALGWKYDPKARVLWQPAWLEANEPTNDPTWRGAFKDLRGLPRTRLLSDFVDRVERVFDGTKTGDKGPLICDLLRAYVEEFFGTDWHRLSVGPAHGAPYGPALGSREGPPLRAVNSPAHDDGAPPRSSDLQTEEEITEREKKEGEPSAGALRHLPTRRVAASR